MAQAVDTGGVLLRCVKRNNGGREGPSVGHKHLTACGVVMHVAEACRRRAVGIQALNGAFAEFAESQVADVEYTENSGWRISHYVFVDAVLLIIGLCDVVTASCLHACYRKAT